MKMNKTSTFTKPQASNTKKNETQHKSENNAIQNRSNTTGSRVNESVKQAHKKKPNSVFRVRK